MVPNILRGDSPGIYSFDKVSIIIIAKGTQNLSFLLPAHKCYTTQRKKENVMMIVILIIIISQQNSPQNHYNPLATVKLERKEILITTINFPKPLT